MIDYLRKFFRVPLPIVVPELKVITYFRVYEDDADIFIDQDAHVFRIDFFNVGADPCDIVPIGGDANGPSITMAGRTGVLSFANHAAYGRKDSFSIVFKKVQAKKITIVTHHLE